MSGLFRGMDNGASISNLRNSPQPRVHIDLDDDSSTLQPSFPYNVVCFQFSVSNKPNAKRRKLSGDF